MDRVVEMLDVRAANAEYVSRVERDESVDKRVGELHRPPRRASAVSARDDRGALAASLQIEDTIPPFKRICLSAVNDGSRASAGVLLAPDVALLEGFLALPRIR